MPSVDRQVEIILRNVSRKGDRALLSYTRRFDGWPARPNCLEVNRREIQTALCKIDSRTLQALHAAARRIQTFHLRQRERPFEIARNGCRIAMRITPLDRIGIYVPGGRALYPSSVLMTAIPARIAGVREIIMTTPTSTGEVAPVILAAASIAGVTRIFKIGGAQAIAALAYGTRTIPKVDKIVGPGNIFVATAKKKVFGTVDIDMIAGPTELLIIADRSAKPAWVAADLISQAEHDPDAVAKLLTPSGSLLRKVRSEVARQLNSLPRQKIARQALSRKGILQKVGDLEEACALANRLAPEHLELMVQQPRKWITKIRHAGALFIGPWTPVAAGDYAAGPNHVLPTGRTARFASPLGVYDFVKRSSMIELDRAGLATLAPTATQLAMTESLTGHAESIMVRLKK